MRISDWSSDVCSSDLLAVGDAAATLPVGHRAPEPVGLTRLAHRDPVHRDGSADATDLLSRQAEDAFQEGHAGRQIAAGGEEARHRLRCIAGNEVTSEERTVGQECVRRWEARWST